MSIIVDCPHCNNIVEIIEINCAIFRHGVYKNNNMQIGPHEPKEICDNLFNNGLIYGCGKPFRLIRNDDSIYKAIICDYI